jgi:hypothetical protein
MRRLFLKSASERVGNVRSAHHLVTLGKEFKASASSRDRSGFGFFLADIGAVGLAGV